MNYARTFERVYCSPLALSSDGFRSLDAVLRPRLLGQQSFVHAHPTLAEQQDIIAAEAQANAGARKKRPRATTVTSRDGNGNLTTTVTDPRLYGLVGPGVAAVPMKGILARNVGPFEEACLGLASYEAIAAALLQADAAEEVQEIIIDADTPGGECLGAYELADVIANLSKPVYGFSEGLCCSCGILEISQADEIYITCSAVLGSIGVISGIVDDSQYLAQSGLKIEYFTAGAGKAIGQQGYALSDADRATLQLRVDTYYAMFVEAVLAGRGLDASAIAPIAQKSAQLYIGQQSLDAGLADGIVSGFDELVQLIVDNRNAA
jgi:signal peptide peptidase SppA